MKREKHAAPCHEREKLWHIMCALSTTTTTATVSSRVILQKEGTVTQHFLRRTVISEGIANFVMHGNCCSLAMPEPVFTIQRVTHLTEYSEF